jgi:hypothetical protein
VNKETVMNAITETTATDIRIESTLTRPTP